MVGSRYICAIFAIVPISGCAGMQSALDPAGVEAAGAFQLLAIMAAGAAVIWLAVMAILIYAGRRGRRIYSERAAGRLILIAGAVIPTVVLAALLAYGLSLMPIMRPLLAADQTRLRVEIVGEQFWWRVTYHRGDGEPVVSANEVRLPVGQRVTFTLKSADVIHSFWIPAIAGKMDMIPGRENSFSVEATRPGIYRSPCAEFCGPSHALMAMAVAAMEPADFDEWLKAEADASPAAQGEGLAAFEGNGCGACHAVRGTQASGTIGPDLSHIGSRHTLGAGILPNDEASLIRFIAETDRIKPGVRMPAFRALPQDEIVAIARYLKALQ